MSERNPISVDNFIPKSLGGEDLLFEDAPLVGNVEFNDGIIALLPSFFALVFLDSLLPSAIAFLHIPLSLLIAAIGVSTLFIKPNYLTLTDWIKTIRDYRKRPKELEKNFTDENGESINSVELIPDDDTREVTKLKKAYPEHGAIELDNGTMVSVLSFSGSNIDIAPYELKIATIDSYAKRISSQLEDDIQFYMPLRPISTESTAERYEERLDKIQKNDEDTDFLEAYIQNRINFVRGLSKTTYKREIYVVVSVKSSEVMKTKNMTSSGGLSNLPGGEVFEAIQILLSGERKTDSKQELKRNQLLDLDKKRNKIGSILSIGPGNTYTPVESYKQISLLKEFWEGEKYLDDEIKSFENNYNINVGLDKNQGDEYV